jgi:hypothetical protein
MMASGLTFTDDTFLVLLLLLPGGHFPFALIYGFKEEIALARAVMFYLLDDHV